MLLHAPTSLQHRQEIGKTRPRQANVASRVVIGVNDSAQTMSAVLAAARREARAQLLPVSASQPALRKPAAPRKFGTVDPLPLALGRPGGAGVAKFVDELILSAENELHYRGLGRSASGEARLAVWREVLSVFATHMPACSTLLTRVLAEFDSALRTLQGEVEAVESKLAEAWQAQQRAEQSAFTVRRESEKRVASAVAQSEAHEKAKRAFQRAAQLAEREARKRAQEARASSQLSVEVVLGSVRELSEPLRLDCLSRAVVEALPARLQTPLLVPAALGR